MKTKITTFIACLFLSMSLIGQTCVEEVTISTPPFGGDIELNPYQFVDGEDANDTYTVTPATVGCDDVGTTAIQVNGPNGFTCTSSLVLIDDVPPVSVVEPVITLTLVDGTATLLPSTVDDGSYDACTPITINLSQTEFTCDDIGINQVAFTAEDENGNWNQAMTIVKVIDNTTPILLVNDYLNVSFDNNGEAVITFDMVEEGAGSFDQCGEIIKSLSQTEFDCSDAGEQNVIFSAQDESGNLATEIITINFEDKIPPVPVVVNLSTAVLSAGPGDLVPTVKLYAEDFDIGSYDNCGIVDMTINKDVYTCEDIGENEVVFTVFDAAGNSNSAVLALTIVDNSTTTTTLACNDEIMYSTFENLPYTVSPYDVLEGGPYGCDFIFFLEIEDENGDMVPDNYITAEYLGQTLTYTVYNFETGDNCFGTIVVSDEDLDCDFDGEQDIDWPLEQIDLNLTGVDVSELTPEYIAALQDFDINDTYPSLPDGCDIFSMTYTDDVIITGNEIDKILRTFFVLDWINYDADTEEGLYEFVQLIKNTQSPNTFICDFLPNSAPVGDCESGHSLEDDVEWPDNITIEDHRIEPQDLVSYSGIDAEDAEPIFYGDDAVLYSATYVDEVADLTAEVLKIDRNWTVSRTDGIEIIWNYTQTVCVNFSSFSNLVAVNTHGSRGVPQVDLGNSIMTDQFGKAIVEGDASINPEFSTEPLNGLDVVDIYLLRQQVLNMIELNEYQQIASEINNDNNISSLDIALLANVILGKDNDTEEWSFVDITENNQGLNNVKGHYVAIKTGDIDDSALLPGESAASLDNVNLTFMDKLLNNGETYTVDFKSDAMINASGIELRMKYNPNVISVESVTSEIFDDQVYHAVNEATNTITILLTDVDAAHFLDGEDVLFNIEVTAQQNGVLQQGLFFDVTERSFIFDEDLIKYTINGSVEDGIVNGTNDDELTAGINIFPNPTVDFINIDLSKTKIQDEYSITLFNAVGKPVVTQRNHNTVNTSNLPTGAYVLYLTTGDSYYSEIIQIIR